MTTPMMQQYREAKARHPGMLVLFRMGDFYELFDDDAELAARLLGLTLTSRDKVVPMAGFPHHQLDNYIRKLIQMGHRVAVCDQVEDAALAKGLVKRAVVRVVTPGTVTEDELLDPRTCNHLVALWARGTEVGLAWVELSVGRFLACDVPWPRLADELSRLAPSECLIAEGAAGPLSQQVRAAIPDATITSRPDWTFDDTTSRAAVHSHFAVSTMSGFGFDDDQPCLNAAGALVQYLRETLMAKLAHLRRLQPYRPAEYLFLDDVTRRSLELTQTLRDGGREGSLLSVLDRTVTAMGARQLHDWLVHPLTERQAIEGRLDAVEEFLREHSLRSDLRDLLGEASDLQRLTARISTGRATPRDLGAVARTLRLLPRFKAKLSARRARLVAHLESQLELCPELRETLDAALAEELPQNPRDGGVFREGYHAELDALRKVASGGKEWIAQFQAEEIRRTGINSLKVGFNQVFGYYIEITNTHVSKIPPDYTRKQTLKNAERYITSQLKEYEEKVLGAEDKIKHLEFELFVALRERVATQTDRLLQTADVLATIDTLASLAELASSRQYRRPELCDEPILEIKDGRHPVLDHTLPPGTFVPNDVYLGDEAGRFWLITGPNMSGKSVFLRQCALLTLLAHMGSFVPAGRARVGITDRIFTRVGAGDELHRGQSTFMVEMTEAANILNNATPRSLVILDEIGRGTATYDGLSLAWAITEHLHDALGCRALFATHYHELAQLTDTLPALRNHNVQVSETRDEIVFLHKIAPGSADKSYGIHVARLAGVPPEVLDRARDVLTELETRHVETRRRPVNVPRRKREPRPAQPTLFGDLEDGRSPV